MRDLKPLFSRLLRALCWYLPLAVIACSMFFLIEGRFFARSIEGDILAPNGVLRKSYTIRFDQWRFTASLDVVGREMVVPDVRQHPVFSIRATDASDPWNALDFIPWASIHTLRCNRGDYVLHDGKLIPMLSRPGPAPSYMLVGSGILLPASRTTVSIGYVSFGILMILILICPWMMSRRRNRRARFEVIGIGKVVEPEKGQ
jgi:hypothetical protein